MADRGLLSFGVFLVIVVISILLYQPVNVIRDWILILPVVIALSGLWLVLLAGMRSSAPQKHERGAFSTFSWGLLLVAIGGAWLLYGYNWYYSLIVMLLVFAGLAIVVAMKRK